MDGRYRVPKRRVRVGVRIPGLGAQKLYVFLGERAEQHPGRERPSDLFNGRDDFLPVEDEHGRFFFLSRQGVSIVEVAAEDELEKDLVASA
ncbi:MAG: hypothetical protein ACYS8K_07210, partial [Planctomycetota bacterium]